MMKKYMSAVSVLAIAFVAMTASAQTPERACTMEARICPDGTSVGRVGPNCEFAHCGAPSLRPDVREAKPGVPIPPTRPEFRDIRQGFETARKNFVASTTEMRRDIQDRANMFRASTTETRKELQDRRQLLRASSTEAIREMQDRIKMLRASTTEMRKDIKDVVQKKRVDLADGQARLVGIRLDSAIDRIQKLSDRITTALANLSAKGTDVTIAQEHLGTAKTKLDEARLSSATIKISIEEALASQTPKENLIATEPQIKDTVIIIQDAQHALAQAITSLKPAVSTTSNVAR